MQVLHAGIGVRGRLIFMQPMQVFWLLRISAFQLFGEVESIEGKKEPSEGAYLL
jgi:hypothetical protein